MSLVENALKQKTFAILAEAELIKPFEKSSDYGLYRILMHARHAGVDGRLILYQAMQKVYAVKSQPTATTTQPPEASAQGKFECPNCHRQFKSQAALSGHGTNRCKK